MTAYNTYSERKLHSTLDETYKSLLKWKNERENVCADFNKKVKSIDEKIKHYLQKEAEIHQALIDRLTPNEETAEVLKNPSVYGTFNSHEEFEKFLEAEENNESKN